MTIYFLRHNDAFQNTIAYFYLEKPLSIETRNTWHFVCESSFDSLAPGQ